jgi:predicted nucleic acid-binding Zn ribbon protein
MDVTLILFILIALIIKLILLVKIWLMTNDVNSIKRILQGETINKEADDGKNNTVIGVLIAILIIFGIILLANF